jgi:ribosome-associated toxin RatA of RatAB toxin-antitoxin module
VLCGLLAARPLDAAEELSVEATRRGERFEVRAKAELLAPAALVWEVLTDYERLPRFVPGLSRSTVRGREGNRVRLEQSGEARFLFFSYPIELQLEVLERPLEWVASQAVGGNMRRMHGRYELYAREPRGTTLLYYGEIVPEFRLPRFVGPAAVRAMIEQQFTAMVEEIDRRAVSAQ